MDLLGDEEEANKKENSKELAKRSSVLDRFPEAFVFAVRDTETRCSPDGRKSSSMMKDLAFTGVGLSVLSEVQFKSYPRSDFDFQSSAAQMRLTEIQKAQRRRLREKVMRELKQVLERIRLSLEEYYMTEKERIIESPDEELLEEERKRRRRERRRRKTEERKREEQKIASQEQEIKSTTTEEPDTKLEELTPGDSKQQTTETNKENEQREIDEESSDKYSDSSDEDYAGNSNESDTEDDSGPKLRDKVSNTLIIRRVKREKILNLIDCYLNLCNEREDIIRQMQFWMEATVDEKLESSGPAAPFSPSLLADELTVDIATEVDAFGCNLKRLKDISDLLGIGDSGPDETQDDGKGKKLPPGRGKVATIFNEEELSIAENWLQATTGIEKCFEEAIKSTPIRRIRLNLGNAAKQFQPICRTVERKLEEIQQLDKKVNGLEGEIKKMKKTNEDLRKRSKKAQVKAEKLEHQNRDLQNQLREHKNNIEEPKGRLEEIQKESRSLQRGSSASMASLRGSLENISVVSLVDTPSQQLAPTGEKVTIKTPRASRVQVSLSSEKSIDSEESVKEIQELKSSLEITQEELKIEKEKSVNLQEEFVSLHSEKVKVEQERSDLEIQLEDARRENERALEELSQKLEDEERKTKKMALEIECNEEMIKYQEERLHQFMEEIQAMEERIMSLPSTPATMSIASMAGPARRERRKTSLQLGLEPQTARQMVAKVKQQYEEEIQSLKEHMAKETQRHQAEMRRTEQDHKKDVQNIHKESMLLLRALNTFKDCVAALLEREHLSQEAHAIRSLAPLPLDEKFGDTRQMLARMAILSNELLTSLELHLSRGLMSKRLEMKDTTFGKTLTQLEFENQGDALRKSKDLGALQMGKLKTKREELLDQRNEYANRMLLERGKQQDVVERFKELQTLNTVLDKEMKIAKKTSDEAMHKKELQLKKILQREIDARRTVEQQKIIIKSLASIWRSRRIGQKFIRRKDQLKNFQLLEEAMAENEIPQALYENTTKLIREAMLFPRKRFIELVKKYIHFRRVKEIQENVAKVRMESSVNESVLLAMKEAEERMLRQNEIWRQKKELFCKARSEALENLCEIISTVQEETGILLTKPIELIPRLEDIKEDIKEIDDEDIREAVNIPKEHSKLRRAQAQLEARLAAGADLPPSSVDGMALPSDRNQGPLWKAIGSLPAAVVTTPRLLDLEINRSRFAAQSALSRLNKGPWDTETVSLPPLSFFPSCGKKLTHRLRETRSEPSHRKKITKTVRSAALPSIASLFPEEAEREIP